MSSQKQYSDKELMSLLDVDRKTLDIFQSIRQKTIAEAKRLGSSGRRIRVLGVSGSARDEMGMAQEKSNSEELLEACLEACRGLKTETEIVKLRKYSIKPCQACYSTVNTQCHFPCSCFPQGTPRGDDMSNVLYDKILAADVIIFATPVNNFKMSSLMAMFLDRCISIDGSLPPANSTASKDKELNIKHAKFIELTADNTIDGSGYLRRFSGKVAGIIVTGHEEGASMVISSLFMTLSHYGMLFPPFNNMYAMSSVCLPTSADKEIVTGKCYIEEAKILAENMVLAAKLCKNIKPTEWKNNYNSN